MKLFIVSDIHGSLDYLEIALKAFEKSHADRFVCLGDFYYHGPRNPLPKGYNPKQVSIELNKLKDIIIPIQGNCDAEVDQMISEFTFVKNKVEVINGKKVYFHHGHHEFENDNFDIVFSGHTHVGVLEKRDGIIYANPGSLSLPKADNSQGYMIFDETGIRHFDLLTDKLIKEIKF